MRYAGLGPAVVLLTAAAALGQQPTPHDDDSLLQKAQYFQQDLIDKHWLDGLYVSIVPATPPGTKLTHTVDGPGNVIHAGVWTGRYLAGVGYQYAVTGDPQVRRHGGEILAALRKLQEVTGKPGLLARGYVRGHGPVKGWEQGGGDSAEWHQGQGAYADYRWYGDVSVDNFNAVLYGYAVYYDLAADEEQKKFIAYDVDRLMTHLLDNHCRIVDVDGEVTRYGHVGIDPDPARDAYYEQLYGRRLRFYGAESVGGMPLRASLMLLPDLLIAHHITGRERYRDVYQQVVRRFKDDKVPERFGANADPLERLARTNHSSEGQAYEALYNLIRYERDPVLLERYREWVTQLWQRNWQEGNALFAYMTLALLPEYAAVEHPGSPRAVSTDVPHAEEGLHRANETLVLYPVDRVLRPVMNSLREEIERNPHATRRPLSAEPLPINERPLDNEYVWKGNPYELDGWLKPTVTAMAFSCDDRLVGWFCDSTGRLYLTLDAGQSWHDVTVGLMGAGVRNITASATRTSVLWAETDRGKFITRDGGMSWREAPADEVPAFASNDYGQWHRASADVLIRIADDRLVRSTDGGKASEPAMDGWRIPIARSVFATPWGILAGGPGGYYRSTDGKHWQPWKLWSELETGAADFLHAYWMGRYYGFVAADL